MDRQAIAFLIVYCATLGVLVKTFTKLREKKQESLRKGLER